MKHEVRRKTETIFYVLFYGHFFSWFKWGSNPPLQMTSSFIGWRHTGYRRQRLKAGVVFTFWFNPLKILLIDLKTGIHRLSVQFYLTSGHHQFGSSLLGVFFFLGSMTSPDCSLHLSDCFSVSLEHPLPLPPSSHMVTLASSFWLQICLSFLFLSSQVTTIVVASITYIYYL